MDLLECNRKKSHEVNVVQGIEVISYELKYRTKAKGEYQGKKLEKAIEIVKWLPAFARYIMHGLCSHMNLDDRE